MHRDWPRLLPGALAASTERRLFDIGRSWSSLREYNWDEGRLPRLGAPATLPCLTSRRAWAPKLVLLAKDGLGGPPNPFSSSSITALSSLKLLRNSGELAAEEVEMLARRCLAKALYGVAWPLPAPPNPRAEIDMPLLC